MKKLLILCIGLLFFQCSAIKNTQTENSVRIANEELEYEIIIFDVGFESYLVSIARPMDFL